MSKISKTDVAKVLREGTQRQKTILFLSDYAQANLVVDYNKGIITEKDREAIFKGLKNGTHTDKVYYNELRRGVVTYFMFRDGLEGYKKRVYHLQTQIENAVKEREIHLSYEEAINKVLKKINKAGYNKLLIDTLADSGVNLINSEAQDNVVILEAHRISNVALFMEMLAEELPTFKHQIQVIKAYKSKHCNLKPLTNHLKELEREIAEMVKDVLEIQNKYKEQLPEDYTKVLDYDSIEVDPITEEDILMVYQSNV